jgi:hypothetical protein
VIWLQGAGTAGVEIAELACAASRWAGFVLPRARMSGGVIHPVVAWTAAAADRWSEGNGPVACRPTLVEWEAGGPPSAIRIVGFIHVGSPVAGVDRLKAVSAYGPGILVVRDVSAVGRWTFAEADVAGLSVVEVRRDGHRRVELVGRGGPVAHARRSVATRLREEQLFDWALRAGREPSVDGVAPVGVLVS